jgi:hypothetical protein
MTMGKGMLATMERLAAAAMTLLSGVALAQAPMQQQPQQAPPQQQPPQIIWEQLPRMQLEGNFAGPLKDTTIQRWRDTSENVVCYIYAPFNAQHSTPTTTGYVVYGPNQIGTISCVPGRAPVSPPRAAAPAPKRAPQDASASPQGH